MASASNYIYLNHSGKKHSSAKQVKAINNKKKKNRGTDYKSLIVPLLPPYVQFQPLV